MPRKSLRYVNTYKDRTGVLRSYLRMPGKPQVAIAGVPGTAEFKRSYMLLTAKPPKPPRPKVQRRPVGQIYYLSDGEHIKIGFTTDWTKRKRDYSTYSPRPLELLAMHPGTEADEKRLHRLFGEHRARREWFHKSPELLAHIQRTLNELNCLTDILD